MKRAYEPPKIIDIIDSVMTVKAPVSPVVRTKTSTRFWATRPTCTRTRMWLTRPTSTKTRLWSSSSAKSALLKPPIPIP